MSLFMNYMTDYDKFIMDIAVKFHEDGEFIKSYNILEKLCDKYVNSQISYNIIKLFFFYQISCSCISIVNKYDNKLYKFKDLLDEYFPIETELIKMKRIYAFSCLRNKKYEEAYDYLKYLQPIIIKQKFINIHPDNTSYFKEGDKNKTLLIYFTGGIGDKIMFGRFIKRVLDTNLENNVLLLIDDNLFWIYGYLYKDYCNIKVFKFSQEASLPHFDYHTNIP